MCSKDRRGSDPKWREYVGGGKSNTQPLSPHLLVLLQRLRHPKAGGWRGPLRNFDCPIGVQSVFLRGDGKFGNALLHIPPLPAGQLRSGLFREPLLLLLCSQKKRPLFPLRPRLADMGDPPAAAAPNRSDVELVVASAGPRRQSRVSVSAVAFVVGLGLLVLALTPPKTEPAALVARYDERVYRAYLDKGLGGDALPGLAPAVDTITANGIRWAAASDAQAAAAVQARIQSSKRTNAAVSAASSAVRRATASVAQRATIDGWPPLVYKGPRLTALPKLGSAQSPQGQQLAAVSSSPATRLSDAGQAALAKGRASSEPKTNKLDMADEGGDEGLQVASAVKDAVGDNSEEGGDLGEADYVGPPDDTAAVEAVQAAVKAGADAEVDDAVAKSKQAALNDYAAAKSDFLDKEAEQPDGGVGGIIAMEGEPGHPIGYARRTQQQHMMAGTVRRVRQQGPQHAGVVWEMHTRACAPARVRRLARSRTRTFAHAHAA